MAVQKLNEFLINEFYNQVEANPRVDIFDDGTLVFNYKIKGNVDITHHTVDVLNAKLKYRLYSGEHDDISFRVMSWSMMEYFTIKLSYIHVQKFSDTYFALLIPELFPIIMRALTDVDDVKSTCVFLDKCSDQNLWKSLFRYQFPQIYRSYIKLGHADRLNMKTYISFLSLKRYTGKMIQNRTSNDYLDYFSIINSGALESDPDKLIMANVILDVKHPYTYHIFENNLFLKDNLAMILDILLADMSHIWDDIINRTLIYNQPLDTMKLLEDMKAIERVISTRYDLLYTFLQFISFDGIPVSLTIPVIIILGSMLQTDTHFSQYSRYRELSKKIGTLPLFRLYIDKLKKENTELYQSVVITAEKERLDELHNALISIL